MDGPHGACEKSGGPMKLTEILLDDHLPTGAAAIYEGEPYVWTPGGVVQASRVVPLFDSAEMDPERAMTELLVATAEYAPTLFLPSTDGWVAKVEQHFAEVDLKWSAVVLHPDVGLEPPTRISVVGWPALLTRIVLYCLAEPVDLGVRAIRSGQLGLSMYPRGVLAVVLP